MVKRVLAYLLPTLIIMAFATILGPGDYLKKPRDDSEDVLMHLQQVEQQIINDNWDAADRTLNLLETAFGKIVPRVQFSTRRDDIVDMERSMSRLRGAIQAQEKGPALTELSETNYQWHTLGK